MIILDDNSVYAVLVYHTKKLDENLLGIYTTRETADKEAEKCRKQKDSGYVCVLKQNIQGPYWKGE